MGNFFQKLFGIEIVDIAPNSTIHGRIRNGWGNENGSIYGIGGTRKHRTKRSRRTYKR